MSDKFIHHLISFIGALVVLSGYLAGYFSAGSGWWWTAWGVVIVYLAIYKLIKV